MNGKCWASFSQVCLLGDADELSADVLVLEFVSQVPGNFLIMWHVTSAINPLGHTLYNKQWKGLVYRICLKTLNVKMLCYGFSLGLTCPSMSSVKGLKDLMSSLPILPCAIMLGPRQREEKQPAHVQSKAGIHDKRILIKSDTSYEVRHKNEELRRMAICVVLREELPANVG